MMALSRASAIWPALILSAMTAGCGGGGGGERRATAVVPPPPPPPPVAIMPADDAYTGVETNSARKVLNVLANDGDGVEDARVQCVSRTKHGASLKLTDDAQDIVYTPALGFSGTDEFRYRAVDGRGNSGSATVLVRVEAGSRSDDLAPVTPTSTIIDSPVPISRLHDFATPSVITPGQRYRISTKPLHSDEVPPFSDDPRKEHIHRFPLKRSQVYDIHVLYNDLGGIPPTTLHPTMSLIDGSAEVVENVVTTFDYHSAVRDYRPRRSETHYISLFTDKYADVPPRRGTGSEDTYLIWAEVVDDNAGTTDTQALAGGSYPVAGRLETSADQDWFRVNLPGGVASTLTLNATGASGPLTLSVRRADAPSTVLASAATADGNAAVSVSVSSGALGERHDYFMVVAGSATGPYEVTTAGGDVPSDTDTYGRIVIDADDLQGFLGRFPDADWYAVHLQAGRSYYAVSYTFPARPGWMLSPAVGVYDETGRVLFDARTQYAGGCSDPACAVRAGVAFAAPYSGTYYISAERFDRFADGGLFMLEIIDRGAGGEQDYSANFDTVARIETGQLMTGRLDSAADVDWLRLELRNGEPLTVHASSEDVDDLRVRLLDTDGLTELAEGAANDDGSVTLRFRGRTSFAQGAIEVRSTTGATGGYVLRREGGDPPRGIGGNPVLGFNGAVAGQISSRQDEDVYRVSVVEGESYLFELEPDVNAPVTAQDYPYLELMDGSIRNAFGNYTVLEADEAAISHTAVKSGALYLRISNRIRSGGARGGAYLLRARNTSEAELCEEF